MEARQTINKQKRLELYAEIESIVNEELPYLYIHNLTLLEAGVMNLKGYQPAAGLFTTKEEAFVLPGWRKRPEVEGVYKHAWR